MTDIVTTKVSTKKPPVIEYTPNYRMTQEEAMELAVRMNTNAMLNCIRYDNQVKKNDDDWWMYVVNLSIAAIPTLTVGLTRSAMPEGHFTENDWTLVHIYDRMRGDGYPGVALVDGQILQIVNGARIGKQKSRSVEVSHIFKPDEFGWYMDWYMDIRAAAAFEAEDALMSETGEYIEDIIEAERSAHSVHELYRL